VEAQARLSGLLIARRKSGGVVFFNIRDLTGSIQVIAERDALGHDEWEIVQSLRKGERVTVVGRVGLSHSDELSVCVVRAPTRRADDLSAPVSEGELDYQRVGTQMLLARLRGRFAGFFQAEGFLELEPNFISTSWKSPGLEPLRVEYQGFGFPAFLMPSPASQLVDALAVTGVSRAFAVSRCFSTTYRDEKSSAESLILVAKALDLAAGEQQECVRRAVISVLRELETLPEHTGPLHAQWRRRTFEWPPRPGPETVLAPMFEVYRSPNVAHEVDGARVSEIFRLIWPPNRTIAEGARETLEGGLDVTTVTIHIERVVSLLQDVPLWQVHDLERMRRSGEQAVEPNA
jgi:hypothetical protein